MALSGLSPHGVLVAQSQWTNDLHHLCGGAGGAMKIYTFEEWRASNPMVEKKLLTERHACGWRYERMLKMDRPEAKEAFMERLRKAYDEEAKEDLKALREWEVAVETARPRSDERSGPQV